ncbi:MAG: DUF1444 family protein [Phycisphaerales bacterium]|nr:DUF1444 family protein [Phycisphaerales bacterium]
MPEEPEAFAEQVAVILGRMMPEVGIETVGPSELLIDGRRLDLENLRRLVATDPTRGVQIVEQYLDHLFDDEALTTAAMPWQLARARVMPRIQPDTIFDHLVREQVAHIPYVNETSIVFVLDMPHMTVSITTEQMVRWGIDVDELDRIARENLLRYSPELNFRVVTTDDGGRAMILTEQDGYDASRLLLHGLFSDLAPRLGGDFYVATPSRDMLLAMSTAPEPFISKLKGRIDIDFARLPYPITNRLFYVTRDGVAGTQAA